ncbi:LuxR C-terminal-related transcriptional regulator [Pendulispora albinea]|uniref:LuxR C-terminal-related transcriptional regulator n=1 Tax=Pendulispora albinea TaxID=2741071 RepID=A0ABZ2MAI1_9BACT
MRNLVPASGAFFCFGRQDREPHAPAVALGPSLRVVDGAIRAVANGSAVACELQVELAQAFGLDPATVVTGTRRAYLTNELRPGAPLSALPYFRHHAVADGFVQAILVPLYEAPHEGGRLFAVCGLERREHEPAFTPADVARMEQAAPFVLASARAHRRSDELLRERTALRSLAMVDGAHGTLLVVDRSKRQVVWATRTDDGERAEKNANNDRLEGPAQVDSVAEVIIGLAESHRHGETVVSSARLGTQTVMGIADIEEKSIFASGRCVVAYLQKSLQNSLQNARRDLQTTDKSAARTETLSAREHEVGRLLVAGYSRVNIAAIVGLSENTVRTYMRRLYSKLGVSNRVDLVREFSGMARGTPPP